MNRRIRSTGDSCRIVLRTGSVRRAKGGDMEASIARVPANAEKRIKQRGDRMILSTS